MKDEFLDYLIDILTEIENISEFIKGYDFKRFTNDKKTINAVIRSLEVIGEASKNIPSTIKEKHKDIPWKEMAGMRDKLIHEYSGVDLEIVYTVATDEIPPLKSKIKNMIKLYK